MGGILQGGRASERIWLLPVRRTRYTCDVSCKATSILAPPLCPLNPRTDRGPHDALPPLQVLSLPKSRQTLLFSATLTKSVKSLVRISLNKDAEV